jgi:hypothetical protein
MDGSYRKDGANKFRWSFSSSGNNDLRCKRFVKMNSNKKQCEMVLKMCGLILFQFPMGTYFLKMNM